MFGSAQYENCAFLQTQSKEKKVYDRCLACFTSGGLPTSHDYYWVNHHIEHFSASVDDGLQAMSTRLHLAGFRPVFVNLMGHTESQTYCCAVCVFDLVLAFSAGPRVLSMGMIGSTIRWMGDEVCLLGQRYLHS